ncbi:hypothetical protein RHGRI_034170 [Rhododendron griersonianum]|uniref:Uncharacterized protein n=1 Tax=Rhododendron griersonianum TaxID=479676 RepID=A0AAV6I5B0_9ERIC|nr:hypothetical protein RHGRI_034170 [Rhododendron griersonianum]
MTAPREKTVDIALHSEYKSSKVISDFSFTSASFSALFELASLIEDASLSAFELSGATNANKITFPRDKWIWFKKLKLISSSDFYCDMAYSVLYFSFTTLNATNDSDSSSISDASSNSALEDTDVDEKSEMTLLDLYSGCKAMSIGLFLGAVVSGVKLVTV